MESNCMKYPQELINSLWNCTDEAALTNARVVDALTNIGPASIPFGFLARFLFSRNHLNRLSDGLGYRFV
jgi:hypothetical protein